MIFVVNAETRRPFVADSRGDAPAAKDRVHGPGRPELRGAQARFAATPRCQGDVYGWSTTRFGSVLLKSRETHAGRHDGTAEADSRPTAP